MDSEILKSLEDAENKAKSLLDDAQAKAKEIIDKSEAKGKSLLDEAEKTAHEQGKLIVAKALKESEKLNLETSSISGAIHKKTLEAAEKNCANITADLCKKVYEKWPS